MPVFENVSLKGLFLILKTMFLSPHGYEGQLRPLSRRNRRSFREHGHSCYESFYTLQRCVTFPKSRPIHESVYTLPGCDSTVWGSQDIPGTSPRPHMSTQVVSSTEPLSQRGTRFTSTYPTQDNTTEHLARGWLYLVPTNLSSSRVARRLPLTTDPVGCPRTCERKKIPMPSPSHSRTLGRHVITALDKPWNICY